VSSRSGYFFPGAESVAPDYLGVWVGVIIAAVGMIALLALLAGFVVTLTTTRDA
jgi:hypothetical protein